MAVRKTNAEMTEFSPKRYYDLNPDQDPDQDPYYGPEQVPGAPSDVLKLFLT